MNRKQYLAQLKVLELHPHGVRTREVLGLKPRQLARLAAGTTTPSPTLQRLIKALTMLRTAGARWDHITK